MPVFLYFLVYLFACLGLASILVPLIQPWVFTPIGLEPENHRQARELGGIFAKAIYPE